MRVMVPFTGVWVTDPVSGLSVRSVMPDRVRALGVDASIRALAKRDIVVRKRGGKASWAANVTMQLLTDLDVDRLDSWAGRTVLLRDSHGWRRWGMYSTVEPTTSPDGEDDWFNTVPLAFRSADWVEEV